jgi:hypothetical protein
LRQESGQNQDILGGSEERVSRESPMATNDGIVDTSEIRGEHVEHICQRSTAGTSARENQDTTGEDNVQARELRRSLDAHMKAAMAEEESKQRPEAESERRDSSTLPSEDINEGISRLSRDNAALTLVNLSKFHELEQGNTSRDEDNQDYGVTPLVEATVR